MSQILESKKDANRKFCTISVLERSSRNL